MQRIFRHGNSLHPLFCPAAKQDSANSFNNQRSSRMTDLIKKQTIETAAVRPPARTRAPRAPDGRTHSEDTQGTPPTNRVPLKYNPKKTKLLRFGVDSLYLSYPGVLSEEWNIK